LYASAIASLRARGRQAALIAAGSALIVSGGALLVAAFLVGGDGNNGGRVAASVDSTSTPTPVEQAAGVRTTAPATPTPANTVAPDASPTQALVAAETAVVATPTAIPPAATPTQVPAATSTLAPSPTVLPTPTSSPTPSGPSVSISGPVAGQPGAALTFAAFENPAAITRSWSASNGASAAHASAFTVTFATTGCHSVTVTAIFPGGVTRSATRIVAVGVDTCG
jgi:hypothetical protein